MRIEAYNQVQQLYNNSKKAVKAPTASQSGRTDQIQISNIGKDFQTAKAAVKAGSDVREDVIAPLKAEIASGTYFVSGESFAERMLQRYEESSSLYAQ